MASTDARPIPQKNVAYRITFPLLDADGDLVSGATGLDSEVSKDGGTFADATNEATEIATASGVYFLDLTSTEMNADTVAVIVKTTTAGAKTTTLVMYPEEAGDIRVNLTQWLGAAPNALVSSRVDASVGAMAAGTVTAAAVATGAIDADALAADAADEIANAVLDEPVSGHTTVGTLGQVLQPLRTGTAQAGDATSLTLDAGASATNGVYVGALVVLTGGTGAGQARRIQAYNGTSKVATVPTWVVAPDATTQFVVLPDTTPWKDSRAEFFALGSFGEGVNLRANAVGTGEFAQAAADKVWATATRALTDKAGFSLSAAGIQAIWDALTSVFTVVGSIGKRLADNIDATISSRPTAAQNSTQVWTEPIPGTFPAGSAGAKLNSAGSAGDPWSTALPGAYGAGTAGNIVGNRLDVAVSTRLAAGGQVTLDLTQAVPTSNTAQTVGDALNAARAQGFGRWVLSGTTLTLYAADGSTVVRTFTLDNSTTPSSRT